MAEIEEANRNDMAETNVESSDDQNLVSNTETNPFDTDTEAKEGGNAKPRTSKWTISMDGSDFECEEETGLNLWHGEDASGNTHPIPREDLTQVDKTLFGRVIPIIIDNGQRTRSQTDKAETTIDPFIDTIVSRVTGFETILNRLTSKTDILDGNSISSLFLYTARSMAFLSHSHILSKFMTIIQFDNIISPHAPMWRSESLDSITTT